MTFSEPIDQTKFCLHFSSRIHSAPIILWKISQANQKKFTFKISTGSTCNGEICVYVSKFVLFNFQYFEQLAEKLKYGNFEVAYSNYKRLSLKAFGRKNLILPPEWSPERFIQINYLGPVIAFKVSNFETNRSLENFEIFEKTMKSKVVKINSSGYITLFARNQDQPQQINYITEYLSKNNSKVIATVQSKNRIKLSYKDLAPKKISVVIPTRGTLDNKTNKSLVYNLLKTINTQISSGVDIEVVVVYDNDTNLDYLQELRELSMNFSLKTVAYQPPFNFSKKCNLGAMHSSGDVFIFLNDDTEFITQDALIELSGTAMTANTGAVGAKLYFANKSIQHAGTVIIGGNLGHAYFKQFNPVGFHGDLETVHEVSAVTGACLAMRREIWQKINGWDEQLENSYNDVELCFRLRDLGLRILQNNFVELYHFESFTRDATYSPAAKSLLESKWHEYLQDDPYFPQFTQTQPKLLRSAKRFVRRQLNNLGLYK